MKPVLILGGSGFVGRHLCEKLTRRGIPVTVPSRRPAAAAHLQPLPTVTLVRADVHDEAALTRLMAGHGAVVHLVAILHGSAAAFERNHVALPVTIARACAAAGVRRLVHVSALGATADGPSRYQRSKAAGEQVLQAAGLDLTVFRPSVVFGPEDRFINTFAQLQQRFPVIPLARTGTRFQPVWVQDLAEGLARALTDRTTVGQTIEAVGPDVLTLGEIVALAGELSRGASRPIVPIPDALGRLQALLLELAPGEPLMSRDNLDSLKTDNVATGTRPDLRSLGVVPSSLAALAPTWLGLRGPRSDLLAMRRTAGRF